MLLLSLFISNVRPSVRTFGIRLHITALTSVMSGRAPVPGLIDLSKATKLKEVAFATGIDPEWVMWALKSITPHHHDLRYISLRATAVLRDMDDMQETSRPEWLELDSVFVRLWESLSARPNAWYRLPPSIGVDRAREIMGNLFPETTKRGILDLSTNKPLLEI